MATYSEIQDWVNSQYGWMPQTCWIAHCKEIAGLPVSTAWNRANEGRAKPCPPDKRDAILEAFEFFGMTARPT